MYIYIWAKSTYFMLELLIGIRLSKFLNVKCKIEFSIEFYLFHFFVVERLCMNAIWK